jgi:hypothetical protein
MVNKVRRIAEIFKLEAPWVSEWLLCIANSANFQPYHGENKLIFLWDDDEVRFVQNQHAYSASSLK